MSNQINYNTIKGYWCYGTGNFLDVPKVQCAIFIIIYDKIFFFENDDVDKR